MFQCKAKVIADSISAITGKRMTTFEIEFPRIILAEFNTHKALNRNASSSRAIPVNTMLDQVRNNPAMPVRFGAANKGMQDAGEHDGLVSIGKYQYSPEKAWGIAAIQASRIAEAFHEAGYAKQVCNRLIEPFQMMKVVCSATDWANFFWLRDHEAADPTIEQLAKVMRKAMDESTPVVLQPGEWHVPYYNDGYWKFAGSVSVVDTHLEGEDPTWKTVDIDKFGHTLEHALTISSSCCAQVSYRKLDDTLEKAKGVVARLNLQGEEPENPVHASPLEHQATPMEPNNIKNVNGEIVETNGGRPCTWQKGVTHMTRDLEFCSGNLNGFIQHRQLVPNHVKRG
ncbi:MAG: putative thymidylate synthase [Caudoviricetes sp.]|nr:MAG: putative thymidylate synthase [Caudoviricetes sp.]